MTALTNMSHKFVVDIDDDIDNNGAKVSAIIFVTEFNQLFIVTSKGEFYALPHYDYDYECKVRRIRVYIDMANGSIGVRKVTGVRGLGLQVYYKYPKEQVIHFEIVEKRQLTCENLAICEEMTKDEIFEMLLTVI